MISHPLGPLFSTGFLSFKPLRGWLEEGQDQSTDAYQAPIAPLTKSSQMSVVSVGSSMDPERLVHWSSSI